MSESIKGELLSVAQMREPEWLVYENLILETSRFGESSEIDGFLTHAWMCGNLDVDALAKRYFDQGDQDQRRELHGLLRVHAEWVSQRYADSADAAMPALRLDLDLDLEDWQANFDPQLWLLGWLAGLESLEEPASFVDERLQMGYSMIHTAALRTQAAFDQDEDDADGDVDFDGSPIEPDSVDDLDADELVDLAMSEAYVLSSGVEQAVSLVPELLPLFHHNDPVLQDDELNRLLPAIHLAVDELHAEIDADDASDADAPNRWRLAWLRGEDDILPEGFFDPQSANQLDRTELERIEARWAEQIEANGGLPFEYVDGFLSAYYVSPGAQSFTPDRVLMPLLDQQAATLTRDNLKPLVDDLGRFSAHIAARGQGSSDDALLGIPAQLDRSRPSEELGTRWSEGFRAGLGHFCPNVENLLADQTLLMLVLPLSGLSHQPEELEFLQTALDRPSTVAAIPELLQQLAAQMQTVAHTPSRRTQKIGRNDPCPCGSGKKYKKCCGAG